jgi:hypothetical protein
LRAGSGEEGPQDQDQDQDQNQDSDQDLDGPTAATASTVAPGDTTDNLTAPDDGSHTALAQQLVDASPRLATLLRYQRVKAVEKPLHARHAKLFLEASDRV